MGLATPAPSRQACRESSGGLTTIHRIGTLHITKPVHGHDAYNQIKFAFPGRTVNKELSFSDWML